MNTDDNSQRRYERKIENVLLGIGVLMMALIIGYNAFFVPKINNIVQVKTDAAQTQAEESKLKDDETAEKAYDGKVNINTATAQELIENLTGVGPQIAKRIIEYREQNGGFASTDEIMEVKGIGEKIFAKLKDRIKVK